MLNKPIVTRDGEWLFRPPSGKPTAVAGRWSRRTRVKPGSRGEANVPKDQRDCDESMIVERRDGSLWQLVRVTVFGVAQSVSKDGGRMWTEFTDYLPNATSRFFSAASPPATFCS